MPEQFIVQMEADDGRWFDCTTVHPQTTLSAAIRQARQRHEKNQRNIQLRKLGVRVISRKEKTLFETGGQDSA